MRVLLADDHPLFLDGLRSVLTARGIEVLGTARNGTAAVELARLRHPDVVLTDVEMPGVGGLAALRVMRAEMPDVKVVVLTLSDSDEDLFAAIGSGACGYLLKTLEPSELVAHLGEVMRGAVVLSTGLAERIVREYVRASAGARVTEAARAGDLTPRQADVLALVAQGLSCRRVAQRLGLSELTIDRHVSELVRRLHLSARLEAIEPARASEHLSE